MDQQNSGIYLIDIDRNGPLPPSHVICDIMSIPNSTTTIRTIVEHNIQHQVVRLRKENHFN